MLNWRIAGTAFLIAVFSCGRLAGQTESRPPSLNIAVLGGPGLLWADGGAFAGAANVEARYVHRGHRATEIVRAEMGCVVGTPSHGPSSCANLTILSYALDIAIGSVESGDRPTAGIELGHVALEDTDGWFAGASLGWRTRLVAPLTLISAVRLRITTAERLRMIQLFGGLSYPLVNW